MDKASPFANVSDAQLMDEVRRRGFTISNAQVHPNFKRVGAAGRMPGTDGFTMAAFKASEVALDTPIYVITQESH